MTLLELIEFRGDAKSRRGVYGAVVFISLLALSGSTYASLIQNNIKKWIDFQYFYKFGWLMWNGRFEDAYEPEKWFDITHRAGNEGFTLWSYPPPYDLLTGLLPLASPSVAYALFIGSSLFAYAVLLRRLAGEHVVSSFIIVFPALVINMKIGQNAFLIGTLVAVCCSSLLQRRSLAGIPLGLLIIKPHLAITLFIFAFFERMWRPLGVALVTAMLASLVSVAVLGVNAWTCFLQSAAETSSYLREGAFPMYHMVSIYASARTSGLSAQAAFILQALSATFVLISILVASRIVTLRQTLGLAIMATMLVGPYGHNYDVAVIAIGLALLLPTLIKFGCERERLVVYGLCFFASCYGLLREAIGFSGPVAYTQIWSPAGLCLFLAYALTWWIVLRSKDEGLFIRPF